MLSAWSQYNLQELPTDKKAKLVFYCYSEICIASEGAAQRAIDHGSSDVAFLPSGIKGWKAAGLATSTPGS
jgi:rhodanese-related sulfurtransferase